MTITDIAPDATVEELKVLLASKEKEIKAFKKNVAKVAAKYANSNARQETIGKLLKDVGLEMPPDGSFTFDATITIPFRFKFEKNVEPTAVTVEDLKEELALDTDYLFASLYSADRKYSRAVEVGEKPPILVSIENLVQKLPEDDES